MGRKQTWYKKIEGIRCWPTETGYDDNDYDFYSKSIAEERAKNQRRILGKNWIIRIIKTPKNTYRVYVGKRRK